MMFCVLLVLAVLSSSDDKTNPVIGVDVHRDLLSELVLGNYERSGGLASDSKLSIKKSNNNYQFNYKMRTHDGGSFVANGPVRIAGDRIDLVLQTLEQDRDYKISGKQYSVNDVMTFIAIILSKRVYLVPEHKLVQFCNEVNLGAEPRPTKEGKFFYRDLGENDKDITIDSKYFPDHIKSLLLGKPILGTVLSIHGGQARIDLGAQMQLRKDMILYCEPDEETRKTLLKNDEEEYERYCVLLKVVDVFETSSTVELYENQLNNDMEKIRKGYRIYSRFPKTLSEESISRSFFIR